jgi:hypothetical protein
MAERDLRQGYRQVQLLKASPETSVGDLLELCKQQGCICPQPRKWQELYELLPGRRRVGITWEPPPPLILGAWWDSSDQEKRARFESHIRWAADHGAFAKILEFLLTLVDSDWQRGDGDDLDKLR